MTLKRKIIAFQKILAVLHDFLWNFNHLFFGIDKKKFVAIMFQPKIHAGVLRNRKLCRSFKSTTVDKSVSKGSVCEESVEEYLENTTLHGLKYVGDKSLSTFER